MTTNALHEQDLTQGHIGKQLWSLAWPMMLSMFFYTLYNVVDTYWVSRLSDEAIAAVSISQITLFVMISLGFGLTVGSGVIMAMNIGAKKISEAERILGQSFVLSIVAGTIFTVIALVFRNQFLIASGASGLIFAPALEYFTVIAAGSVLLFVLMTIMFAFNSQGDTATLTKLFAISTIVNVLLDPLLIFGWGIIPALGISGAAIATLISQAIFIIVALRSLANERRHVRFRFRNLSLRWESVKNVLRIGIPASLSQVIFPLGIAALTYIISLGFLEAGTIAFSLGSRIEFFAYLPAIGFGFGAMAMVSQNIGANKPERALEAFGKGLRYAFLGAAGMGVVATVFAKLFVQIFTTDPLVMQYALSYIWSVALSYGFLAALMVEATTFQAIGKSWPGFWLFLLRVGGILLPLSYGLTQVAHFSIFGIWISIVVANIISACIGYFWIMRAIKKIDADSIPTHPTL